MAKAKPKTPDYIDVRYDLHGLPTAQHKAGLAGLLLQVESMAERRQHNALPADTAIVEVPDQGPAHATFRFTAANLQALFDDLYAAGLEEVKSRSKWSGVGPKRIEEIDVPAERGKTKKEKRYVYDMVKPANPFLDRHTGDKLKPWHKLWQDMLWTILRGRPTTRGPYNDRAAGRRTDEGKEAWDDLVAFEKLRNKTGQLKTVGVGGAILLGAQAINAEAVKFVDRADHALLLHFWQLVVRVFVPERIDADGKRQFVGYTLAIPEVSDLKHFNRVYVRSLTELGDKRRGYRPADAVIALPEQGSLEFMRQLILVAERQAARVMPSRYLSGIEFFHAVKLGNNVKIAAAGRVPPRDALLRAYQQLRQDVHNPLMLAARLKALLGDRPWFADLAGELVEREWSWFVHSRKDGHATPPSMIGFAWEAFAVFRAIQKRIGSMSDQATKRPPPSEAVDAIVYRIVDDYVVQKARARLGVDKNAPRRSPATHVLVPAKGDTPERWIEKPEFQEKRRDAAVDLMLRLRSRQGEDFVEQFAQAISSVAQFFKPGEFELLSAALMLVFTNDTGPGRPRTRDDVKTLTLLALSAASRSLVARADSAESNDTEAGDAGEEDAS